MGDSDSEKGGGGSDAESDTGQLGTAGVDPRKIDELPEKERKRWEKNLSKARLFLDFIFRQLSVATYRYNCFEYEEVTQFMMALERAERLRAEMKLKKGETARINCYRKMNEAAALLESHRYLAEANRIYKFLDIVGRLRGISQVAGNFYKVLKKAKVGGADRLKYHLDQWRGFTVRTFDYAELPFQNAGDEIALNELERKYLAWPTAVKTTINMAQKFLKGVKESTGLELICDDVKRLQQHMQAPEFLVAVNVDDLLSDREMQSENKAFALLGITTNQSKKYNLPNVSDISPILLRPVADDGILLSLPADPPTEKKKETSDKKKGAYSPTRKGMKKRKK